MYAESIGDLNVLETFETNLKVLLKAYILRMSGVLSCTLRLAAQLHYLILLTDANL